MPKSSKRFLFIALVLITVLVLVCGVPTFVYMSNGKYRNDGAGMEPNLHNGQFLLVDRSTRSVQRGDIVIFKPPPNPAKLYIQRVIGLPDETIKIHGSQVLVNSKPFVLTFGERPASYNFGPTTVGANDYFVLGDNRDESSDSHAFGAVPRANIVGKVWFSYWPLSEFGFVK